jgi:uncharacterized protein DUF2844
MLGSLKKTSRGEKMIIPTAGPSGGDGNRKRTAMMKRRFSLMLAGLFVVAAFASAQPLLAALGEPADSVARDRKAMSAARGASTVHDGYAVQEVVSDSVTVREYISPAGIVFAVAWNGYTHPDLTPLLGSYAGEYNAALRKTPRKPGRRHVQIKTDRIVVEKWGHMRNLQGRAYAADLIPQGVSIDEIK